MNSKVSKKGKNTKPQMPGGYEKPISRKFPKPPHPKTNYIPITNPKIGPNKPRGERGLTNDIWGVVTQKKEGGTVWTKPKAKRNKNYK